MRYGAAFLQGSRAEPRSRCASLQFLDQDTLISHKQGSVRLQLHIDPQAAITVLELCLAVLTSPEHETSIYFRHDDSSD